MGTDYNCGYYFMVFTPNPATSETTVELFEGSESDDKTALKDSDELLKDGWEVDVFDQNQALKSAKKKIKGHSTRIDVRGWKKGVYFVRAKVGNEYVFGKFVVGE